MTESDGERMGVAPGRRGRRTRISRSGDFDAVYRRGRSASNRHLVLHAFHRAGGPEGAAAPGAPARLGLSVSRRVGNAVERNRVKRVLREQFAGIARALPDDHDLVVVARPGVVAYLAERGSSALGQRLRELVEQLIGNSRSAAEQLPSPGGPPAHPGPGQTTSEAAA